MTGFERSLAEGVDRGFEEQTRMDKLDNTTPAALHARVSSDRQDVDLSVAAQPRALRDYAGLHDPLELVVRSARWLIVHILPGRGHRVVLVVHRSRVAFHS